MIEVRSGSVRASDTHVLDCRSWRNFVTRLFPEILTSEKPDRRAPAEPGQ